MNTLLRYTFYTFILHFVAVIQSTQPFRPLDWIPTQWDIDAMAPGANIFRPTNLLPDRTSSMWTLDDETLIRIINENHTIQTLELRQYLQACTTPATIKEAQDAITVYDNFFRSYEYWLKKDHRKPADICQTICAMIQKSHWQPTLGGLKVIETFSNLQLYKRLRRNEDGFYIHCHRIQLHRYPLLNNAKKQS